MLAFGDSTTAPRGSLPVYLDILEQSLRGQGLRIEAINAGVAGNTSEAANRRFAHDVLARDPALVIIQFGINDSTVDVWKVPPATEARVPLDRYTSNLESFVAALQRRGCKVILMTPNPLRWSPELKRMYGREPYRADDPDGFNASLRAYAESVRRIAQRKQVPLIDIYAAFHRYGEAEGRTIDDLLLDGMHPNAEGHRMIAERLVPGILAALE